MHCVLVSLFGTNGLDSPFSFSLFFVLCRTSQNTWVQKAHFAFSTEALLKLWIKLQSCTVLTLFTYIVTLISYATIYTHNLKSTEKGKEVLIVKTTIHDIMNKMIRVCIVSLWYIKVDAQSAILSQLCMDVLIYLILSIHTNQFFFY